MRKNLAKRLLVAAVLTTCLIQPVIAEPGRVELSGSGAETVSGIKDSHYTGNFGGAVYNTGTNKTLNGEFSGNSSGVSGGALSNVIGAEVTVNAGSSFVNNSIITADLPQSFGGAIFNEGALTIADGTASNHTSFSGNTAGIGGAIYNYTTGDPVYIGNYTSFSNNTSTKAYGSAIYARSGMTIGDNVSFTNNKSNWGGALASELVGSPSTTPEVANKVINIGKNVLFENNIADWTKTSWAMGGAIVNTSGTINIDDNAQFKTNKAANGGAIANADKIKFSGASLFKGNKAMNGVGGAVTNSGDIEFGDGTFFEDNTATSHGGAIYNTKNVTVGKDSVFQRNVSGGWGGAIYGGADSVTTIGDGAKFIGNVSDKAAGDSSGGAIYVRDAELNIGDNVLFDSNRATGTDAWGGAGGGAIAGWGVNQITIGDNATFQNNGFMADGKTAGIINGGAIYHSGAVGAWGPANPDDPWGDQIVTPTEAGGSLEIGDNSKFINNASTQRGGALYNENGIVTIGIGSEFYKNSSRSGGAIYNVKTYDDTPSITVDTSVSVDKGAQFKNNTASANGGAIYNYGGIIDIAGGESSSKHGTLFSGNNAGSLGGAIYNNGIMNFETSAGSAGDIVFENNKAGGKANDIYLGDDGILNIKVVAGATSGSAGSVKITGGIAGTANSEINNSSNLVLSGVNENFLGTYNQTAGTTKATGKFFGGTSNITGGSLTFTGTGINPTPNTPLVKSEIVSGSTVNIGQDGSMNIASGSDTLMNGIITGTGSIINEGNFTINGDGSGFTGDYTQKSGTTTITADGIFFKGGTNKIEKGVLALKQGASLTGDIEVNDYSVAFNLDGRNVFIGDAGIEIVGKDGSKHYIKGSLNLEDAEIKVDANTGITSDMYLGSGASLTNSDDSSTIEIGKGGENVTLSLGGGFDNSGQTLNIGDGSTISLTPKEVAETLTDRTVLVLDAAITGGSGANIIVDGTVLEKPTDPSDPGVKYDVGTVIINSVNDEFLGKYTQSDGTVIVNKDAVFFGGDNLVDGGTLVLTDGAQLSSDIKIDGSVNVANGGGASDSPTLAVMGSLGEITQDMITNGNFNYANIAGLSDDNIQIDQGGLILANQSIIKNENLVDGTLSLVNDSGVRYLGFANGSGVDGNVSLGDGTALSYGDGAYVNSDSTLTMDNAELLFTNDKSKINYGVEIKGTGSIAQSGSGITNISSALSDATVSVTSNDGMLNFVNKNSTKLGDVDVTDSGMVNVISDSSTIGDVNITGEDASMNIYGSSTIGNTVVDKATLGIFGNSNMGDLSLGSTLAMSANKMINNLNVNNFTLTDDSNITFDANVRNNTTDTINIINGGNFEGNGHQLLITGINLVESPIDRNFIIDTNNIINKDGSSAGADMVLKDGSILVNSEMGKYLLSSSGSSGILNGTLTQLNSQMYRGQVATVSSYANQLVVNNMLFDHMNILANDLMAQDKNANRFAASNPLFAPYQYSKKDGDLWYKAYGNFERISMTQNLNVGNNAYGSLIGADFPLVDLKNGWKLVPTAYIGYNGGHQTFDGVSMYQNGAQLGAMGTAYKGDLITSLLAYGGGYANDMSVKGGYGSGSDTTGNWFAGVASKTAYNFHLPHDLILQPTALVSYNVFGNQNYHSNFGNMSMNSGMLNGVNVAPGVNLIWNKKTFSLYATAQLVFNIMGDVSGKAGNVDLNDVRMRTTYFEYGIGAMKKFKDRFTGYLQVTLRNGSRTGIGFQGGLQWKVGK